VFAGRIRRPPRHTGESRMGWKRKWVKDSIKALLPFQPLLRGLKRRWFPYATDPLLDEETFRQGLRQVTLLTKAGAKLTNATMLELGSGWQPIVPLLFHAVGCNPIFLTDQESLMDRRTVLNAFDFLRHRAPHIGDALGVNIEAVQEQLSHRDDTALENLLAAYGLKYLVPYEIEETPSASIDVITSRAVLEHVSVSGIEHLFTHFRRILKPGGLMCHLVDNSDHWEHGDKSISRVNFLRYPDRLLPILGFNRQNYQNRLRHFEYASLLRQSGFQILDEIGEVDDDALHDLAVLKLSERYRKVPHHDLAIVTSYFVARSNSP
jgi:SAM-dependent methyltransferase